MAATCSVGRSGASPAVFPDSEGVERELQAAGIFIASALLTYYDRFQLGIILPKATPLAHKHCATVCVLGGACCVSRAADSAAAGSYSPVAAVVNASSACVMALSTSSLPSS